MTRQKMAGKTMNFLGGMLQRVMLIVIVLTMPMAVHADANNTDYAIGAGDVLEIMVWKNTELTKILPVRPDGKISLPLVGEVMVEGKKVKELSDELQETYSRYVTDPIIYVSVQQVNSMNVYIIGRVNAPGVRPINAKTNVLQGLSMASGLTPFAEADEINIFRTEDDGTTSIFEFDFEKVSRGRNLHQNIFLKRGDVIVVP
jgi:polysaccharide biosynthesis/export protein